LFLAVRNTQQLGNVLLQNIAGAGFIQNQAQPLIDALKLPVDLIQNDPTPDSTGLQHCLTGLKAGHPFIKSPANLLSGGVDGF